MTKTRRPASKNSISNGDSAIATAYSLTAEILPDLWNNFASAEIESLLSCLGIERSAGSVQVIDVGCGTGRHGIELATRGFRVRAFDFAEGCVRRARCEADARKSQIEASGGSFDIEVGLAQDPKPQEMADLVICLYDVVGTNPQMAVAQAILDGLFRLCRPGGSVVVGCLNGLQALQHIASLRMVSGKPEAETLPPISITMRCREAFEFQKLAYDPESATLYHRERIENEGKVALDAVVGERRYTPVEMLEMLRGVGFVDTSFFSVRAGRWDFSLPFDPIAPEILYLAKRPEALLIIHRDSRALVGD